MKIGMTSFQVDAEVLGSSLWRTLSALGLFKA